LEPGPGSGELPVITIRDVARSAGVSIATVSRVFNGSPRVSEETVHRVKSIAAGLGYWPNGAARSLTTSRTSTIGVLLPDLYGEFFSEVIRGIDQAARKTGQRILVSGSHADSETLLSAARSMRGLADALIVMAPDEDSAKAIEQITQIFDVVLLNGRFEVDGCDTISISNFEGAYTMVRHLLRLQHRTIAIVKGPAGNIDAEERLRGWRTALVESGVEPDPALEYQGDFTESSGYECAQEVLGNGRRPSAVFAANDYMAIGFLSALRNAGVTVPEELAVTGFDDIAIAQYLNPPLTTVRVDAFELGARAVQSCLEGPAEKAATGRSHIVVPTTLVVRSSCGSRAFTDSESMTSRRRGRKHFEATRGTR
jgi:LacI family transcriptional regulator